MLHVENVRCRDSVCEADERIEISQWKQQEDGQDDGVQDGKARGVGCVY